MEKLGIWNPLLADFFVWCSYMFVDISIAPGFNPGVENIKLSYFVSSGIY
jgi:hypothetical protein